MTSDWKGVYPAITTPFTPEGAQDLPGLANHAKAMVDAGCHGVIVLGSLGENMAHTRAEKIAAVKAVADAVGKRVPVLAGVAESSTHMAQSFCRDTAAVGAAGFMVMPAIPYKSDRRETLEHYRAVARATDRPIMIYNNPISYGVDITPDMMAELANEKTIVAIKESSDNPRRVTDLYNTTGERFIIFTGVDDLIVECMVLGAVGWVAGLVNAFPHETVALYDLCRRGKYDEARALYRWFTPLLHLDVHTKLVQYIKFAQAKVGNGTEHCRPPRLPLVGEERARVEKIIDHGLKTRPRLAAKAAAE